MTGGQDGRVILFNDNQDAGGIQYAAAVAGSEMITEGVNRHILELYQYTEEHRRNGGRIVRKRRRRRRRDFFSFYSFY